MHGQIKINQKKLTTRRRRRAFFLVLYGVAAAGLIFSGLSYIAGLDAFSINNVEVVGNSRLSNNAVEVVVWKDMSGNYASFFSNANFLIYPKAQITSDLLSLPLVKSVSISNQGFNTLVVSITERTQSSEWCADVNCYSMDDNGYIFAKAKRVAATSTDTSFIYRGLVADNPIGQNLLPPADFKKAAFFINELSGLSVDPREADLSLASVYAPGVATGTSSIIYMNVVLGGGGQLIINTSDNLSMVLGDISAVISDRAIAPSLEQFLGNLDYMKLDTGNKVAYKMKVSTTTAPVKK